jgi:parallel beta-helix repeat protein
MVLHDSFSDGIYIRFTDGVYLYNNFISDCQHEGFYLSCCRGGSIYNNQIAGICSDNGRLDNCQNFLIKDNIFFSYSGPSYGAYEHGENSLQIGNQGGSSHGYTPTTKPFTTENIEVTNNTFVSPGLQAFSLSGGENVYIHDNVFKDASELETLGVSVGNYSYENPPSLQTSKKVFSSIFDILKMNFSDTGRTEQKAEDIPFSVQQTEQGRIAGGVKILGFKDLINIDNVSYISDNESILYKSAAVRAPSFDWWNMGVSNISQKVTTKIENRTAYAVLTVKMEYYTISVNPITGKTKKNYKISTAVYNDSCPAPEVLRRPAAAKAIITFYNNSVNPHTLVYVPSQGLIKVNYEYIGNSTEHTLMIGERTAGQNRVQITNFSTCDYWRGSIPNQGEALFISGAVDPEKLNITCFTPYESFKITDFEYKEKSWKGESFSDFVLPFVLKIGIILFFLWRLLKIPFD